MPRKVPFVDQLRLAVEESGRSRNSICVETGIDPGVMHRFVKGGMFLSQESLNALAEALGLRVEVEIPGKTRKGR